MGRCGSAVVTGRKPPKATRADKTRGRREMNRGVVLGFFALLAAPTAAMAQASLDRGRYLVDTVMTCHNCHTPMGPNGPQIDKALSGGLHFDEPAFDVTASNITPDRETGIGNWSDAEIKTGLQGGTMPSGFYKILT